MIGVFILFTVFVCFAVTFSLGLFVTLFGFRKMSAREHTGSSWLLWFSVSAGTLVILFILAGSTADFGDAPQPSVEGYEAMARTLVLWAMVPGAALAAGGAANMIRASRLPKRIAIS
jgi:hypothetical protein